MRGRMKSFIWFTLLLVGMLIFAFPFLAYAGTQDEKSKEDGQEHSTGGKTVRVGWYDSSYNSIDKNGVRTGYAYEYQLKLSAYNGWTYEYVTGSWPELLRKLENGEIDLMSDISYTEERAEKILYPTLPMGTEDYYIFKAPGNEGILSSDLTTLNGKKVGVNRNSLQAALYTEWAKENHISSEVLLIEYTEEETLRKMESGELDAYVTVDAFLDPSRAVPVVKVGSSDFYFAVAKNRPDLLQDLNYAMSMIQDENRYYNQEMYEKFLRPAGANAFLTSAETEWLKGHGKIRVGYQDDYMAFCAVDEETGELTGVLKDFLDLASECMPNARIDFEAVAYPTAGEAMNALKNGEVDCAFPANLSGYEAEQEGLSMTPSMMRTGMYAVVRASDPAIFSKEKVTVAVNEGNLNYDAFLEKHYPDWEKIYYRGTEECLEALSQGKADCVIISNYRYNNISRICERHHLTTFSIGIEMDYCFAVNKGEQELYSILSKSVSIVPHSSIEAALSHYITEDAKRTFQDFLMDHMPIVMLVIGFVVLVILVLLIMNIRAVKRANRLISATESDDLTGLYNRKYFFQYANRMYRERGDKQLDAIVLNIEQFHSINELHGRDMGDQVLRMLADEILAMTMEENGIAGRFEADRFDIFCPHREDYQGIYDRLQGKLDELAPAVMALLRMGVMPWHEGLDPVQMFDRARTACNMARGNFQTRLIIYDERVSAREKYEQHLVNDLAHSLETHEFEIYFQPKYDIQNEPPRFVSAEALVRWRHPSFGLISPGDFIPMFEKSGQISLLDKYVWTETAKQIAKWKEKYGVMVSVSVNLSRVDVFDPNLKETLEGILSENGLDQKAFKLEVTESAYTENADQVIRVVDGLRKMGYKVEMDDFGTGYSSLNMLSSMPIDVLKMDMAFVRNIDHNEKDRQLVALIIGIAKNLKVPVIAEGVEREAQLNYLKSMGCEMVQGYYFSRPLPADEFEQRILQESIEDIEGKDAAEKDAAEKDAAEKDAAGKEN